LAVLVCAAGFCMSGAQTGLNASVGIYSDKYNVAI
jgi:hypothetical protein